MKRLAPQIDSSVCAEYVFVRILCFASDPDRKLRFDFYSEAERGDSAAVKGFSRSSERTGLMPQKPSHDLYYIHDPRQGTGVYPKRTSIISETFGVTMKQTPLSQRRKPDRNGSSAWGTGARLDAAGNNSQATT